MNWPDDFIDKVICGDCREVMAHIPNDAVDTIIADPPYGISYAHGGQSSGGRSPVQIKWPSIKGDEAPQLNWLAGAYRILVSGGCLYVMTRWDKEPTWRDGICEAGFVAKQRLTWHKRAGGKGDLRGTFLPTCEDVIFASKGRHILKYRPSMLLDYGCVPTWEMRFHPHQKPISLLVGLLDVSTNIGDIVLDPFLGSGTTAVACKQTGRHFIGIEISPKYCEIARKRLEEPVQQELGT